MTDGQQIVLAITPTVLPTLTVLVGILVNNRQIDSLHKRMDLLESHMDQRFRHVDQRFEMMEKLFTEN